METTALVPTYTPAVPKGESARLATLSRYRILDTPPEDAFENIIEVTTTALKMPIGLITFLDESRQWFKAKRGLPITGSERAFAFCAETILMPQGLLVRDAIDDPRFRYNPFVTGSPFIRFYAGQPLCSPEGHVVGSLGVADMVRRPDFDQAAFATLGRLAHLTMDEVELRLSQATLRTEKQKLEFALKSAGMGEWSWDVQLAAFDLPGTLNTLIDGSKGGLGISDTASLEQLLEVVHPHDRIQLEHVFERLIHQHTPMSVAFRLLRPRGVFWVEINAAFAPDSEHLIIGTVRDVTEQEQWRNKTIRTDRLHALSSLGAGVAHEINNPLSVVTTNLYLLSAWFKRNQPDVCDGEIEYVDRLLESARRGAMRVEDIVSSMLELSRDDETGEERTNPCNVLESVIRLLKSDIPANTELQTNLEPSPPVRGRPSVLAQIFVNLLLNAVDAIEQNAACDGENRILVDCRTRSTDWVDIVVQDTGPGLEDEEQSRIFNPFFTTKPPGKGTGLGLAIAYSIVESLGGDIDVESNDGCGTTARVSLPVAKRPFAGFDDEARPVVH